MAAGALTALRRAGRRVPDDVAVGGLDDSPHAATLQPPLTTIRQPLTEMAEAATRLVVSLSRGERPANLRLDLATSLVLRQSTAAPRQA